MPQRRGFAAMSPETQQRIASMGGKAAHARGTAHEFTAEEAREAGRLGGIAAQKSRATRKSTKKQTASAKEVEAHNALDGTSMEDVT